MIIDAGNVMTLLEEAVESYGGAEMTYNQRVHQVFPDAAEAEVVLADCYYFNPGKPEYINEADGDIDWSKPENNEPLCVVGCLFAKVGITYDVIDHRNAAAFSSFADDLAAEGHIFTLPAIAAIDAAQTAQDNGKPWGEALDAARAMLVQADEGATK